MTRITNTSDDPATPLVVLAESLATGNGSAVIEAMEAHGQTELVNSDRLPVDATGGDEPYLALGFTFGPPDPADPLFRYATLPPGWKRQPSDHPMWSYIVDECGHRRIAIFYKATFYDRRAFMRPETTD